MKKIALLIMAALLLIPAVCFSAVTITNTPPRYAGATGKITLTWVSAADGSFSTNFVLTGTILQICYNPDGGGTQPTDQYDVSFARENGATILSQTTLSNSTSTCVVSFVPDTAGDDAMLWMLVDDTVTVTGAACGDAKGGVIEIIYQ